MRHAVIAVPLALALLTLAACGKTPPDLTQQPEASQSTSVPAAAVFDTVAARANGFSVGNMMATRVVYVLFDSQCPHCGRLWQEVKPLLGQIRMVWAPVRLIGELSAQQGATLLASKDPIADMEAHERSLEANRGGLVPPAAIPADVAAKVAANTKLMQDLRVSSVPFVVYKNQASGQPLSFEGAMTTEDLRKTFGL
jgi:thiol:disulfide interchange protein DsbG